MDNEKPTLQEKMDLMREATEAMSSELFQTLFTIEGERDRLLRLLSLPRARVTLASGEWVTCDSESGLFTLHELIEGHVEVTGADLTVQQLLEKVDDGE